MNIIICYTVVRDKANTSRIECVTLDTDGGFSQVLEFLLRDDREAFSKAVACPAFGIDLNYSHVRVHVGVLGSDVSTSGLLDRPDEFLGSPVVVSEALDHAVQGDVRVGGQDADLAHLAPENMAEAASPKKHNWIDFSHFSEMKHDWLSRHSILKRG